MEQEVLLLAVLGMALKVTFNDYILERLPMLEQLSLLQEE